MPMVLWALLKERCATEPINDDERSDGEDPENIVAEDGAGVFDWNEIDAEIE